MIPSGSSVRLFGRLVKDPSLAARRRGLDDHVNVKEGESSQILLKIVQKGGKEFGIC
jgi:hypothetical protein